MSPKIHFKSWLDDDTVAARIFLTPALILLLLLRIDNPELKSVLGVGGGVLRRPTNPIWQSSCQLYFVNFLAFD